MTREPPRPRFVPPPSNPATTRTPRAPAPAREGSTEPRECREPDRSYLTPTDSTYRAQLKRRGDRLTVGAILMLLGFALWLLVGLVQP